MIGSSARGTEKNDFIGRFIYREGDEGLSLNPSNPDPSSRITLQEMEPEVVGSKESKSPTSKSG